MSIIKEHHILSDYEIVEKPKKSRINGKALTSCNRKISCPNCGKEQYPPKHGTTSMCYCGLKMTVWGNGLDLEMDLPDKDPVADMMQQGIDMIEEWIANAKELIDGK